MKVAVLCCSKKSIYKTLSECDCYDSTRDARTFAGNLPVITHPHVAPSLLIHQAKPEPGEKELAHFCSEKLIQNGGIFEHPAHSRAFAACNLPNPGKPKGDLWTVEVFQAWWNYPMLKKTWLCFSRIEPKQIHFPFVLHPAGGDKRIEQMMSKQQRSATTKEFAEWLIVCALLIS